MTDEDEIAEVFDQAVDALGPVGGLVTSAGIARNVPFEETSAELFRQVIDVNLVGSFIAAKAALERMGDRLAVVNIASVAGLRANHGRVAYGASKAGVMMMSQVMALEYASRGVRVNCICPGPVETPLVTQLHSGEERRSWLKRLPQRRYAEPGEIAAVIAFLLSPEASYISGQAIAVDGGFTTAGILRDD